MIQLFDQSLVRQRIDCANSPMEDSWRKFYAKFTEFRNRYLILVHDARNQVSIRWPVPGVSHFFSQLFPRNFSVISHFSVIFSLISQIFLISHLFSRLFLDYFSLLSCFPSYFSVTFPISQLHFPFLSYLLSCFSIDHVVLALIGGRN